MWSKLIGILLHGHKQVWTNHCKSQKTWWESNNSELLNFLFLLTESEKVRFWQQVILTLAELTELDVFLSMGWKESEPGVGSARLTIFKEWSGEAKSNLDEQ